MENAKKINNFQLENGDEIEMASIHDFGKDDKDSGKGSGSINSSVQGNPMNIPQMPQMASGQIIEDDDEDAINLLINYNEKAKNGDFSEALFRDKQIEQMLSILNTRNHPNVLIKGNAGVGKTQIVEEIARRLVNGDPIVNGILKGITIYELPLSNIVSGSSYVGQVEEKLKGVIDFACNPKNKIILFIDEIHQITGSSNSSPSYTKIAQILKPALGRGSLKAIGATTTQEAVTFMNDSAFSRRWTDVIIPELSNDETTQIIHNIKPIFQKHHDVLIPNNTIEQAVSISNEYKKYGSHRPDSTITLVDKAMSDARIKRLKLIEEVKNNPNMKNIITAQPIPILTVNDLKQSALTLLTGDGKMFQQNVKVLKDTLDSQIIGQSDAKTAVLDAVKRLGLRLTKKERPTSFLFAGPSGTGKTEFAKQITESVFTSKDRMIYLNLSEYSSPSSISRIVGSDKGFIGSDSNAELPFDSLENNPYQVVLLDEFEKAHVDVQRLFMQALDEGIVKTSMGKEIDFKRSLIIATTNAGVEEFKQNAIGFSQDITEPKRSASDIIKILSANFDVELLNRFEKIIAFTSINKEDYIKILAVKYNKLIKEIIENRTDLGFTPDHIDIEDANNNDTLQMLADDSYSQESNGRPAEKTIRGYIEDTILNDTNSTQFQLL